MNWLFLFLHSQTFVYEEDVYYQASPYSDPVRLTTSGEQPGVRNGVPYWNDRGMTGPQVQIRNLMRRGRCKSITFTSSFLAIFFTGQDDIIPIFPSCLDPSLELMFIRKLVTLEILNMIEYS